MKNLEYTLRRLPRLALMNLFLDSKSLNWDVSRTITLKMKDMVENRTWIPVKAVIVRTVVLNSEKYLPEVVPGQSRLH